MHTYTRTGTVTHVDTYPHMKSRPPAETHAECIAPQAIPAILAPRLLVVLACLPMLRPRRHENRFASAIAARADHADLAALSPQPPNKTGLPLLL